MDENQNNSLVIPSDLLKNHIKLADPQLDEITKSIKANYHQGWRSEENFSGEGYANDLKAHLLGRLETDRMKYIPWFNRNIKLNGSNVLEIGCGTGSSTIALAEQGANVTGIDLDEGALKVAGDRCKIYNLKANLICGNACEIYHSLQDQKFDLVIFFACIEHMTYAERIDCLKKYYGSLPKGSYLSIIETPNRLWYFDKHTSKMPFFHWLPDHVAYDYSKYSNRVNFKELYLEFSDDKFLHFLRRGRGFSYHELEIALDISVEKFQIVDYLHQVFPQDSIESKFNELLMLINPQMSQGFSYPYVDIILKK